MKRGALMITAALSIGIAAVVLKNHTTQTSRANYTAFISEHPYSERVPLAKLSKLPKKDRPDLAMRQNYLMTLDPSTGEVPTERLVSAFRDTRGRIAQKANMPLGAIPDVIWQERGPNNVGGRTRALMWDPNDPEVKKLWAAGVAGGIWFNNDITSGTSSWQNVDDFMANLAITCLAYDPTNSQVFYAGTGEGYFNGDAVRGTGIFKSTDGGVTWSLLPATENSTFHYVQRIVVTESGTILASTRNGGVQRSTDEGASWSPTLSISNSGASTSRANDLDLAANGDIYATMGIFSSGSIHRSIDDGLTWTAITPTGGSPERIELAVAQSVSDVTENAVLIAVASNGSDVEWLKKTVDGGASWIDLEIPRYRNQNCTESTDDFTRGQAWYDLVIAIHPTDSAVVVAGGINVLRSSDGGENMNEVSYWTGSDESPTCDDYVHADVHNILFRPGHPNEAVIGSDGGVSYSTDLGSSNNPSFDTRNNNYNVTQFYAAAAENTAGKIYYLGGTQDNGTHQFTDANGFSTVEVTGGDGAFCFIDQDDNNVQISSFVFNVYFRLNGDGQFLGNLSNNQEKGRFINPADYDNETDVLYSAGDENELMRISNISSSPSGQETLDVSLNGEQISALRADADSLHRVFVGTGSGGVYRIDSANISSPTVTDITNNIDEVGYVSSIDLGLTDDEIIVTLSNFGVSSVWYSTNGGVSWVNKDDDGSLPDVPVRWALINPNNTQQVMLATELGVWSTDDITALSPDWEQTSNSLANVRCDMLQYRASDQQVIVATHGRGLFTSDVFGGPDTTPPVVISFSPATGEEEVKLDADLTFTLNEVVSKGLGNITIQETNGNVDFEVIDVTSNQVSVTSNVVSIVPTNSFQALTEYRILIDAGVFEDNSNNAFAGLSNDEWVFTTFDGDEPPTVVSQIPNQALQTGGDQIVLDLSSFFADPEMDQFVFTVETNSNASLVSADVNGNLLTLTTTSNTTGNAEITVRATTNSKFVEDTFLVIVTEPFLYFQGGAAEASSASQKFPDFDDSEIETVDNFIVPEGEGWTINSISVVGSNSGLPPEAAIFRIYTDSSDEPDSLLLEGFVNQLTYLADSSDFEIQFEEPLALNEGAYWLSVMVVQEFGNDQSQWFWSYSLDGDGYLIRDQDQLLGGAISSDWQIGDSDGGLIFGIYGVDEVLLSPTKLTLEEQEGAILLSWTDNSSDEDNYVIERSFGDGSFEFLSLLGADSESYLDPIDSTNTNISYRVRAVETMGRVSEYAAQSILTLPAVPQLLEETELSFDSFVLSWESVDDGVSYLLDVSIEGDFGSFVTDLENFETDLSSYNLQSAEPATYFYRVAAFNESGQSSYSETGSVVVEPLGLNAAEISVFPNPTQGLLNVDGASDWEFSVIDVTGRVMSRGLVDETPIDLSAFDQGTYFLLLQKDGLGLKRKIIKQ